MISTSELVTNISLAASSSRRAIEPSTTDCRGLAQCQHGRRVMPGSAPSSSAGVRNAPSITANRLLRAAAGDRILVVQHDGLVGAGRFGLDCASTLSR